MCWSVNGSVCLVCCVFESVVNCLVKQFAIRLVCGCYFVVMGVLWTCLVWVEVLCWIDCVWSSNECACCTCDLSVYLSVPYIV